MEKYTYKDSKVEWLGKVPEHWKVTRLKNVSNIVGRIGFRGYKTSDLVEPGEGAITLSPSNIKEFNMDFTSCTYLSWYKYEESPEIKIFNGDVIFVKTGSSFGKVGLVQNLPEKATINPQLVVFKDLVVNNNFLFYVLNSELTKSQVDSIVLGGTIPTLAQSKLGRCFFTLPPLPEQKAIADYLDKACTRIDRIIAIKKEQLRKIRTVRKSKIDELICFGAEANAEVQATGLSYLPTIKKGWKTDRFKDLVTLRDEKTDEKSEVQDYLELEDMDQGTGRILGKRDTLEVESKVTKFYTGDVLFGKLRPYLEKYHFAQFDGKCTGEILAFKPNRINGKFLMYLLGSKWFIDLCNSMAYGAKMPRVNWSTQLAMVYLPLPSEPEQELIVKQLDELSLRVDDLVSKINKQINSLKSYRKSLIHECVTGKKQVAEIAIETANLV